MRTSVQRGGLGLTGILLVVAALVALSARAGGPVSWHVTNGTSMLPAISKGALVVVHRKAAYDEGDVVAYHSRRLDSTVLHRVAGFRGDRMIMQGDNNDFLDPESPLPSDALGSEVFQIPGVGAVLAWLGHPWILGAGALLAAGALLLTSPGSSPRRRAARVTASAVTAARRASGQPARTGEPTAGRRRLRVPQASQGVETALRVGIGCSLLLAAAATAGPFLESAKPSSDAERTVTWSYAADAARGLAYPDGSVTTGDAIYTQLVPEADVSAELDITLPDDAEVTGTWWLDVSVRTSSGWTRGTFTGKPTAIEGSSPRLTTTVPFFELLRLIDRVDAETTVDSGQLRILVTAVMELVVDDDGVVSKQKSSSVLSLTADWKTVEVAPDSALEQTEALPVGDTADEVRTLELLGGSLPPGPTRTGGLGAAALGLLALRLVSAARRFEDEDAAISRMAGDLLVPADPAVDPEQVVDVASFSALRQLAQRYDRVVLHADSQGLRFYFVLDDGIAYRYYSEERAAQLDAERAQARSASAPDEVVDLAVLPSIPQPRDAADEGVLR